MAVTIVLTLALGIGAAVTMYGLMSRMLFQPPPHVTEPERVAKLFFHYEAPGESRSTQARWYYRVYERLRDQGRPVERAATYADITVPVGAGADAARARATVVSAGFWDTLGTRPAVGRLLADDETRPAGGARVAVLGYGFWQRRYGGDPGVVGRTLRIRGQPHEIVGVTPRGFRGVGVHDVDLWLPLSAYAFGRRDPLRWMNDAFLHHVVRLKAGVTAAQADAELSRVLSDIVDEDDGRGSPARETPAARLFVSAGPLVAGLGTDMRLTGEARVAVWLVGVAAVLLGVACTNVAGLLLLRALRRRRDIAVCLTLGMSPRRLAAQLFTESTLLALLGGLAAVVVVIFGGEWVNRVLLPDLASEPVAVDPSILVVTMACVLGAAFLAGLAPLLQVRRDPLRAVQEGAARTTARRGRLYPTLLVAQTALSVVLLAGAGLFLRSLHNIRSLDLGLDPDNVIVATVDFDGTGRTDRDVAAFYERALEQVEALPGVERASLATSVPLRSASAGYIRVPGSAERITAPGGDATYVNYVTPGFFATAGTRIIEGRGFLPHERDGAPVVVVNEATARAGWPGRSPVGECVDLDERVCATVVGVAENARRFFLRETPALLFYRPLPRNGEERQRGLFVRVAPGDRRTAGAVTRAVQALEPDLPFVRVQPLGAALDPQMRPWRLGATVFTAFGVLAGLLAAMGLYSALAYSVTHRTREIGVRVAVGARARDVVRLVLRDGLRLALAGVVAGTAISLAGSPWIGDLLFDVSPRDPAVLVAVAALLLAAALVAGFVPSRRATRVDPVVALRAE